MNVLSLNVRGLGEKCKIEWVARLKKEYRVNVICIQETQLEENSSSLIDVSKCWGSDDFGHCLVSANGRSGGMLTI